jgi:hypothetical protein
MYELRRPAPEHTVALHSSELSALPAGFEDGFVGAVLLPVSSSRDVRALITEPGTREAFDFRVRSCASRTCFCWSSVMLPTCRRIADDLEQYVGAGAWVVADGQKVRGVEGLYRGLSDRLSDATELATGDIVATFDPQSGDGTVTVGDRSLGIHVIPAPATELLWWIEDIGDVALVRSQSPEVVEMIAAAVLSGAVSPRVRIAEVLTLLGPVLSDTEMVRQTEALLTAGWDTGLSALAQAVVAANMPARMLPPSRC